MKDESAHTLKAAGGKGLLHFNRKVYVVLICFLISTIFWLLLALSNDYSTSLTFPVRYHNLPGKKVLMNELPEQVTVQIRTSGFRIMAFHFASRQKPIDVDVAGKLQGGLGNLRDVFSFPTKSFTSDFNRQLGSDVSITGFLPDSIYINFSDRVSRMLPVKANFKLSFEKQHDTSGHVILQPAVVEVSGPPELVNSLTSISTQKQTLENLRASTTLDLRFEENKLLSIKPDRVKATIPVEKFTEGQAQVRIYATNVSPGYSLKTFPDRILIRYQVPLSRFNDVSDQLFEARVDGKEVESLHPEKLKVKLITAPDFVRSILLEPEKVDYILRKE